MLRALMDTVDSMKEQMGNLSKEMENLKESKEVFEIKKHCNGKEESI